MSDEPRFKDYGFERYEDYCRAVHEHCHEVCPTPCIRCNKSAGNVCACKDRATVTFAQLKLERDELFYAGMLCVTRVTEDGTKSL